MLFFHVISIGGTAKLLHARRRPSFVEHMMQKGPRYTLRKISKKDTECPEFFIKDRTDCGFDQTAQDQQFICVPFADDPMDFLAPDTMRTWNRKVDYLSEVLITVSSNRLATRLCTQPEEPATKDLKLQKLICCFMDIYGCFDLSDDRVSMTQHRLYWGN